MIIAGSDILLKDFLDWAYSNLLENTNRGIFAEYLVALELKLTPRKRVEWADHDLNYRGLKIEVKATGYVQSWHQTDGKPKRSPPLRFNIGKPRDTRTADIYVFCLHAQTAPEAANPLKIEDWQFIVIATNQLADLIGDQKSVTWKRLIEKHETISHNQIRQYFDTFVLD